MDGPEKQKKEDSTKVAATPDTPRMVPNSGADASSTSQPTIAASTEKAEDVDAGSEDEMTVDELRQRWEDDEIDRFLRVFVRVSQSALTL